MQAFSLTLRSIIKTTPYANFKVKGRRQHPILTFRSNVQGGTPYPFLTSIQSQFVEVNREEALPLILLISV